jgi:hypothetical protein
VRPGEQLLAAHDLRQQFVPLARRAGLRDQVGAHDRCRHVRFDQQPAAELLHDSIRGRGFGVLGLVDGIGDLEVIVT